MRGREIAKSEIVDDFTISPFHDLTPAIAAGAALSFARGVSEYGSLVLLSGNLPFKTEVTSVRILSSIENDNPAGAAAVATVLLAISLFVIVALDVLQRRLVRRG